jgi:hypothetical protein
MKCWIVSTRVEGVERNNARTKKNKHKQTRAGMGLEGFELSSRTCYLNLGRWLLMVHSTHWLLTRTVGSE